MNPRVFASSMCLVLLAAAAVAHADGPRPGHKELAGVVYHGARDQKLIALTFDACSSRKGERVDQAVVDELIALNVPATLFLGGKWMRDEPGVVDRLASIPNFELATHGYMHPHMTRLSTADVAADMKHAVAEFEMVMGRKPSLMRAPYGELDERVAKLIEDDGITPVQFDLPGADSTFSKKTLVKWVTGQAKPGSIVVLHMNGHGKHTAEALPEIVDDLRKQGFTFATVSELMGKPLPEIVDPILASTPLRPGEPGPMCNPSDGAPDIAEADMPSDDTPEDEPVVEHPGFRLFGVVGPAGAGVAAVP